MLRVALFILVKPINYVQTIKRILSFTVTLPYNSVLAANALVKVCHI